MTIYRCLECGDTMQGWQLDLVEYAGYEGTTESALTCECGGSVERVAGGPGDSPDPLGSLPREKVSGPPAIGSR